MISSRCNGILLAAVLFWSSGPVFACTTAAECDDGVACTADSCETAGGMSGEKTCVHTPRNVDCFDGNACTADTCTATGCVHPPTDCSDNSSCTVDTCDRLFGCEHTVDCDDGIPCTRDFCDNAGGMSGGMACFNEPEDAQCDDGDACTTDTCSAFSGCGHAKKSCDDSNPCTVDTCDSSRLGCINTVDCNDGIACTRDFCDNAGDMSGGMACFNEPEDTQCDDGDACTTDTCSAFSGCRYAPIDCDDGDACTDDTCSAGTCGHAPVDCDDDDQCTIDACAEGQCTCEFDPACAAQGCSAGYWKANPPKKGRNAWPTAYTPSMKVGDVFDVPSCIAASVANASLAQALGFTGGASLNESARRLARAGVAAVLNAAGACVQYPMCLDEVVAGVNAALASCDRRTIVDLAAFLEARNALGCPLDQRGGCANR